ncbi:hypothetical protein [Paenibacillus glycanilyticus]|uniref:hypothetical protein n=1 Tax=Paenibacillus glycanilyticus TaxID=126569 RepID=UPI003EBA4145
MKLEVTVCQSVIEQCFEGINDVFGNNILLNEIKRRRIVLHDELIDIYEEYFRVTRSDYFDLFSTFLSAILNNEKYSEIIDDYVDEPVVHMLFPHSRKDRVLANICNNTRDKLLLSNTIEAYPKSELEKRLNIKTYNAADIIDIKKSTILNSYKIPIFKRVARGGNSSNLSSWLGRFLLNEDEITIIDNYLYENSDNFYNYILNHIDNQANIKLITKLNGRTTENDLINKFMAPPFNSWNITEILVVSGKREQHARNIVTNNYIIMIDKGMAVFGTGTANVTDQADISIHNKEDVQDYVYPRNIRKIV